MSDTKQNQNQKTAPDLSRLVTPSEKKSSPHVPEKTAKEIRFEHLGGKKILHHAPVNTETPISFEHIGGVCIRPSDHPANATTAPTKSEEDEGDES